MTIRERQFQQKLAEKNLEVFQRGEIPSNVESFIEIRDFLANGLGLPSFQFRPQIANSVIDVESYNKSLKEISFDMKILFDELISHFQAIVSSFHLANTVYQVSSKELERLINELDEILITIKNADDHFQGYIERFDSLDKTDQRQSTPGIVDLNTEELSLPSSSAADKRINAIHLFNLENWPVQVLSEQNILSSSSMVGAGFGKAFSDTISAWRHKITSSDSGKLIAEFKFPVAGPANDEKEVFVNKILISPHSEFPFRMKVLKSVDDVNYTTIPGYTEFVTLDKQSKKYSLDFSTELIQFLKIIIEKDEPDVVSPGAHEYLFGFYSIQLFTTGRIANGSYFSKPFDCENPIGRVALESSAKMPKGTEVNYFVGLADTTGALINDWKSISPVNTVRNDRNYPNSVRFGEVSSKTIDIVADLSGSLYETYKANGLYSLTSGELLTEEPLFGSAELYRGEGYWSRDKNSEKDIFFEKDVYIDFSASDTQTLYVKETETLVPKSLSGSTNFKVDLSYRPYYDPTQGHTLVPNSNVDPNFDQAPTYAIYSAEWVRSQEELTATYTDIAGNIIYTNLTSNFDSEIRPKLYVTKLTDSGGTVTVMNRLLREEIDYLITDSRAFSCFSLEGSWWFNEISRGSILDFYVVYRQEDDLIDKVDSIVNNSVVFNGNFNNISPEDSIRIRYRRAAALPSIEILYETLKVKPLFGNDGLDNLYAEGQDYSIDLDKGSIYRIQNGSINTNGIVYVDFGYKKEVFPIETFSLWCYVSRQEMPEINISTLRLKKNLGEQFLLNSPKGVSDLSSLGKIPSLNVGWHQFIVKSINPSDADSLIRKIILLKDRNNIPVFNNGGEYFSSTTASRNFMRQIPYDYLKKGILPSVHDYFAIKDNRIIVNFAPNTTDDIYPYYFDTTTDTLQLGQERFKLKYAVNTKISPSNRLLVKIDLVRRASIDGGITPKVSEYLLRIAP